MGPVVHKHRFVSVSSVGGAGAGGAANGTAGDAGITKTEVPAHGDEPLGFRVWKGQAVSAYHVGGWAGQPKGAGTSGTVTLVDVADVLNFVILFYSCMGQIGRELRWGIHYGKSYVGGTGREGGRMAEDE